MNVQLSSFFKKMFKRIILFFKKSSSSFVAMKITDGLKYTLPSLWPVEPVEFQFQEMMLLLVPKVDAESERNIGPRLWSTQSKGKEESPWTCVPLALISRPTQNGGMLFGGKNEWKMPGSAVHSGVKWDKRVSSVEYTFLPFCDRPTNRVQAYRRPSDNPRLHWPSFYFQNRTRPCRNRPTFAFVLWRRG